MNGPVDDRPKLYVVSGPGSAPQRPAPPKLEVPRVLMLPADRIEGRRLIGFAFELARALAAQTARTGGLVFVPEVTSSALRGRRSRRLARTPLAMTNADPLIERDGVAFFAARDEEWVIEASRGQMPHVVIVETIEDDQRRDDGTSAILLVFDVDARDEYVELVRSDWAGEEKSQVFVARLTERRRSVSDALARRNRGLGEAALRPLAWELAAEMVLS